MVLSFARVRLPLFQLLPVLGAQRPLPLSHFPAGPPKFDANFAAKLVLFGSACVMQPLHSEKVWCVSGDDFVVGEDGDVVAAEWAAMIVKFATEEGKDTPHPNHMRLAAKFFAEQGLSDPMVKIPLERLQSVEASIPPQMAAPTRDLIQQVLGKLGGQSAAAKQMAVDSSELLLDVVLLSDGEADVAEFVLDGGAGGCEDLVTPPGTPEATEQMDWNEAAAAPGVVSGGVLSAVAKAEAGMKRRRSKNNVDASQPARKKPKKEVSFALKMAAIYEAKAKFQLEMKDGGGFLLSIENRFQHVSLQCLGGMKKRLDHISEWAVRMQAERWRDMARHKGLIEKHGADPLSEMSRLPVWWLAHVEENDWTEKACTCVEICSSDEEQSVLETYIAKQKRERTTRKNMFDNFPGVEKVIRQFNGHHERTRDLDDPCDFAALEATFADLLLEERKLQLRSGLVPDVPEKVSRGWFSSMKLGIGIKDSAVGSKELKRLTGDDDASFWSGYERKAKAHGITITNIISFDEFNDFMAKAPKRVQTSAKERQNPTSKRVSNTNRARTTLTVCLVFSPLRKGKVLLFMKKCPKETAKHIREDFGEDLILVVGEGKCVNGTTHVKHVLGKLLKDFIDKNKEALRLGDDEWHMFMQDQAPCHVGDNCRVTGETGLKKTRRAFYQGHTQ